MRPETTLFYDVDTQRDFILPDGRLAVPGTDRIIPRLAALSRLARRHGIRIIASADRHFPDDPELQRNGGEYADHCMDGTPGQQKIAETALIDPLRIENRILSDEDIENAISHKGEILLEKQRFDVFTGNRNAARLLRRLLAGYKDVVVYGVYTEVCVRDAIRGLLTLGPQIHVVTDAIADIGAEGDSYRAQWRGAGVELISFEDLEARLKNPP